MQRAGYLPYRGGHRFEFCIAHQYAASSEVAFLLRILASFPNTSKNFLELLPGLSLAATQESSPCFLFP
jgi:hypothetical protein